MTRRFAVRRAVLAVLLILGSAVAAEDVFKGVERVVAVGDVHGDYEQFTIVLRSAGLIDEKGTWTGGKAHLVQTGDVVDRGPESRKVLELLIKLEKEARAAGGYLHFLLGNHEAMNLYGDLRYVSPEEYASYRDANSEKSREASYRQHQQELREHPPSGGFPRFDEAYKKAWEDKHPLGYAEHRREFGPGGKYGRWLRQRNVIIKIDDTLFVHAGIGPKYADTTIRKINEKIRAELDDFRLLQGGVTIDPEGPLWYRGMAQGDEPGLASHVQKVLAGFKVKRVIIGHTFTDGAVTPRFGGAVLMIDVGLARLYDTKLRLACLLLENGQPFALHRGKKLGLPSDGASDMLRYLKEAAALDPQPSSLLPRIAALQSKLGVPATQ